MPYLDIHNVSLSCISYYLALLLTNGAPEEGGHFDLDHNQTKDISLKVKLIRLLLLFLDEIYKYVIDDKMGLTTVVSQE